MNEYNIKKGITELKTLILVGTISFALAVHTVGVLARENPMAPKDQVSNARVTRYATSQLLSSLTSLEKGTLVETAGFYVPGDRGDALYRIQKLNDEMQRNGADVIALNNRQVAIQLESKSVNYKMFGAVGDGESDDGVQIKPAHEYANRHQIPTINLSGEFWIKQVNNIKIKTNVHWGNTTFHIDERFNHRRFSRFVVLNDKPTRTLKLDKETKAILLKNILATDRCIGLTGIAEL
jgi:hypothetical protein